MKIDPSTIPSVHVLNVKPVTVKNPDGTERKVWRGVVRARTASVDSIRSEVHAQAQSISSASG